MLELRNIIKNYPIGNGVVRALKGINLTFRKSEFVSILGPSGCGKTTMLNIIGGLDQYTSGDLLINGRSTKNYNDRDWDIYRNHSIGFVFQSYNLIPHQTVLQNVELALTFCGVSKSERKARAKKALEEVGLGDQLYKKPNELSGGQMQRVAIARALVNDPDIVLADEPTGALDTETSVQVMELLKEISKDRLIIMVTHNPELAEKYATRIIRMLDGVITDDSMPYSATQDAHQTIKAPKKEKKAFTLSTVFHLSFKNLLSKKARTLLTSFAGSIGIIGIALILAISQGTTSYIDAVQEEALSSYPITIEKTTIDMGSLMSAFMQAAEGKEDHKNDAVYKKSAIYDMINALNIMDLQENDLKSFKEYLQKEIKKKDDSNFYPSISGIQYSYDLPLLIYTKNADGTIVHSDTNELMSKIIGEYMGANVSEMLNPSGGSGVIGTMMSSSISRRNSAMAMWQEMLPGKDGAPISDVVKKQYDLVYGSWPNSYDEIVLVLDENNELDDITLYALGLLSEEEIDKIMSAAMDGTTLKAKSRKWTYKEICDLEYRLVLNSSCFSYDDTTGLYNDLRDTDTGIKYLYDNGIKLKISGIIRPNEEATSSMISGSIGYTSALTKYVITESQDAPAIKAQKENPSMDVVSGLPFKENTSNLKEDEKAAEFREYLNNLSSNKKATTYIRIKSIPSKDYLEQAVTGAMAGKTREEIETTLIEVLTTQMGAGSNQVEDYVSSMTDDELNELYEQIVTEQIKMQYAQQVVSQMATMSPEQLIAALDAESETYTVEQCAQYYDEIIEFSDTTYEDNLLTLGYVDLEEPSAIHIFASSFANKDIIEDTINAYNEGKEELEKIKYTDYIGIMLASVTTIINAITYVLVAFVAISLVVSSIMIGVITLISVQERTKEIGILRAIGASKKNVSSMFTAETVMIGFTSGLLGVLVTYGLCIPINAIIQHLTGISNLSAFLPVPAAIILVCISIVLTLISGLIPSRSAAKKDPVIALRTE